MDKLQVDWVQKDGTNSPVKGVVGSLPEKTGRPSYFPEGYLAEWFQISRGKEQIIWLFPGKTGVMPLVKQYQTLISELQIDALLMIDGGVDSIMHGDEVGAGTILEDSISLAAVSQLDVPVKILACLGFGTEAEEGVCHYHTLGNIADLIRLNGFYGSCSLTKDMESFQLYEQACRYVWEHNHAKSHISTRIIPATHGEFGDYKMYDNLGRHDLFVAGHPTFVNPLMSQYWFFDVDTVAQQNLLVPAMKQSNTFIDAKMLYRQYLSGKSLKPDRKLPL